MPNFPSLPPERPVRFGLGLCLVGFLISLTALVPPAGSKDFPWAVIAGSFVYLPGAILAFMSARGPNRNQVFMWLRFVRLGIAVVLGIALFRVFSG